MSTALSEGLSQESAKALCRRGTSNGNSNGNSTDRKRRKLYLLDTYRADVEGILVKYVGAPPERTDLNIVHLWVPREQTEYGFSYLLGMIEDDRGTWELVQERVQLCRCYRCGELLHFETLTVDRIVPGCVKTAKYPKGGTYVRENIRPCCSDCNSETGGALAHLPKPKRGRR